MLDKSSANKSPLVDEVWMLLDGNKRYGVTKQAIITLFLAILSTEKPKAKQDNWKIAPIGKYNENNEYSLSEADIAHLRQNYWNWKKYSVFFRNDIKSPEAKLTKHFFSFAPHANSRTAKLENSTREKSIYFKTHQNRNQTLQKGKQITSTQDLHKCRNSNSQE